ncbi:hypothetical protein LOZ80_24230 [Paenibacillus sp. HWE-109]|uniref:hypothetical protein n=1 Tax=Paenibacillus sp. HWE-109 TaxID=1306526 RepID=UPI001EDDC816|nr:hypothetical protein [Paenibacillus sp. HWE-109]UKS24704.1 hypothetical protein LOZ80_24230 [Paenibacillus sp. HWE-109]
MFEMLISQRSMVSIRCGKDDIKGIITHYHEQFQLLKISNVLIPIELIEQIEVLEPASSSTPMPLIPVENDASQYQDSRGRVQR